jgi:YfiH family protein
LSRVPVEVTLAPEVRGSLSVYPVEALRRFSVDAFITDRFGGVSEAPYDSLNLAGHVGDDEQHVKENRRRVAEAVGVEPDSLITISQVHGNQIVEVGDAPVLGEGDGMVSKRTDVALAVLVADCVPLLLVDESSPRFGVVHAGWRGLAGGVIASALSHFESPEKVHVFVGPSISAEGYQVGPEVATHFASTPDALYRDTGDRSRLDLRRVVTRQLSDLGLIDEHVTVGRQSTDGGEIFFSDRAMRPCGRFGLIAKRSS